MDYLVALRFIHDRNTGDNLHTGLLSVRKLDA